MSGSRKRAPAWTDRIMYTTYADAPDHPQDSAIVNLLYTTIPSYTTSDHVRLFMVHIAYNTDLLSTETHCISPSPSASGAHTRDATPQAPATARLQTSPRSLCDSQTLHRTGSRAYPRLHLVSVRPRRGRFYRAWHRELHSRTGCLGMVAVPRPCLTLGFAEYISGR